MTHSFPATTLQRGLSEQDLGMLGISGHRIEIVPRDAEICSSNEYLHVLVEGWACKYRLLKNGSRQVFNINLSGEICDLDKIFFPLLAFGVQARSSCRVMVVPLDYFRLTASITQPLCSLLWYLTTLDNIAMTELLATVGRRSARERVAWFFCNLEDRLRSRGQLSGSSFCLEIGQADIADLLGLSLVHTNRNLQELKSEGLIGSQGSRYTILDPIRLRSVAGYDTDALL